MLVGFESLSAEMCERSPATRTRRGGSSSPSTSPNRGSVSIWPTPAIQPPLPTGMTRGWGNATLNAAGRLGAGSFSVPPLPKSKPGTPPGPCTTGTGQLVDRLDPLTVPVPPRHARHRPPAAEANAMSGIDPQIPITMLPVRIETRFAGTPAAPRLLVRLYPDDVHVDHHDPRLTSGEVAAGTRYWTSVRAGTAGRPGVGAAVEGRRTDTCDLGSSGAHAHQRIGRPRISKSRNGRRQCRRRGGCASAAGLLHRPRAVRRR